MSRETALLSAEERAELEHTVLHRDRLEEQFINLDHQRQAASLGMWVFLGTEVMFFGTLFLALGVYHYLYPEPFMEASAKLNWQIGGTNALMLLVSSYTMALAVHFARLDRRRALVVCLAVTALLGSAFLCLKGYEYYTDYQEHLIPGWRFKPSDWIEKEGLRPDQVPQVMLFLILYWIGTGMHALHLTIGIVAVLVVMVLAWRRHFSNVYYAPVDVAGIYWSFVDIVWIFLVPMLYLLGKHTL